METNDLALMGLLSYGIEVRMQSIRLALKNPSLTQDRRSSLSCEYRQLHNFFCRMLRHALLNDPETSLEEGHFGNVLTRTWEVEYLVTGE